MRHDAPSVETFVLNILDAISLAAAVAILSFTILSGCSVTEPVEVLNDREVYRYRNVRYCNAKAVSISDGHVICDAGDCLCHDGLTRESAKRMDDSMRGKAYPR